MSILPFLFYIGRIFFAASFFAVILVNPTSAQSVAFTFDDGPHPEATPYVLDELKKYNAKASFFCIGKNVAAHPDLYNVLLQIMDHGRR